MDLDYAGNALKPSYISQSRKDCDIWQSFKQGDRQAFAIIYEVFVEPLFSYGMKIQPNGSFVQDCIHDLFVDLWRQRSNLSSTDNIKFYLFRALRRRITSATRREKKLYADHDLDDYSVVVSTPYENNLISDQFIEENNHKILKALVKLTDRQREVIDLLFFERMSYEEVSEIMMINVRSVYTLAWKALSSLKKHLMRLALFPFFLFLSNFI